MRASPDYAFVVRGALLSFYTSLRCNRVYIDMLSRRVVCQSVLVRRGLGRLDDGLRDVVGAVWYGLSESAAAPYERYAVEWRDEG